jgi:Tfp pilus assembly PilM family ATPase
MPRSIGLDVSESAVRAVELDGSARRLRILRYAEREIVVSEGRPWPEAAAEAVAALAAGLRLPAEGVVAALDSGDVLFRLLTLPFKSEDQIRKVVKFELESQLQNYTADDLIVDTIIGEHTEKGTLLLAVAAPKEVVKKRLALFGQAGIDPASLDLDVNALFNALAQAGGMNETVIVAHGGARFAKLLFVQRGIPRLVRSLRFSLGPEPDAAPAEAPAAGPAVANADDRVALLAREITRFLLSGQSSEAPVRILLTGEFARRPEVAVRLSAETGLPAEALDPLRGIEHTFGDGGVPTQIAIPLGLALKGLGLDRSHLDFRQEEFVPRRRGERLRRTFSASVFLVFLLLLLVGAHFQVFERGAQEERLDSVLRQVESVLADVYPEKKGKVPDRERILEAMKQEWRKEGEAMGAGAVALPPSALDATGPVFDKLRELLAQQTAGGRNADFHITLDQLNYTVATQGQGQLEFSGQISSPPLAESLQNILKTVPDFESVALEGLNARPDGKYSYTLKVRMKKPG